MSCPLSFEEFQKIHRLAKYQPLFKKGGFGNTSWQPRLFYIWGKDLYYFVASTSDQGTYKNYKGVIDLSQCSAIESVPGGYSGYSGILLRGKKEWILSGRSQQIVDEWFNLIKAASKSAAKPMPRESLQEIIAIRDKARAEENRKYNEDFTKRYQESQQAITAKFAEDRAKRAAVEEERKAKEKVRQAEQKVNDDVLKNFIAIVPQIADLLLPKNALGVISLPGECVWNVVAAADGKEISLSPASVLAQQIGGFQAQRCQVSKFIPGLAPESYASNLVLIRPKDDSTWKTTCRIEIKYGVPHFGAMFEVLERYNGSFMWPVNCSTNAVEFFAGYGGPMITRCESAADGNVTIVSDEGEALCTIAGNVPVCYGQFLVCVLRSWNQRDAYLKAVDRSTRITEVVRREKAKSEKTVAEHEQILKEIHKRLLGLQQLMVAPKCPDYSGCNSSMYPHNIFNPQAECYNCRNYLDKQEGYYCYSSKTYMCTNCVNKETLKLAEQEVENKGFFTKHIVID